MLFLHNTTSWPFGPALSVYRIVQCFGAVNVPVWVIFEGPQGMSLACSKVIKNPCTPLEFEKWNKLSVVLPQINKKKRHKKVPMADRSLKIYIKHPQTIYIYPVKWRLDIPSRLGEVRRQRISSEHQQHHTRASSF